MVQAREYIEAPNAAPLPFGLMSAAVTPDADAHGGFGFEYETDRCGTSHSTVAACVDPGNDPELETDDGRLLVESSQFTVYALHKCRNVGLSVDPQVTARNKLDRGDWRGIEEGFAEWSLPQAADITPTPGTPLDAIDGLALLEEHAATVYGFTPVVHVPRSLGTVMASRGAFSRVSNRLETVQGALVASGGGYVAASVESEVFTQAELDGSPDPGDGTTPTSGQRWIWATGLVVVRRGAVVTTPPVQTQALVDDQDPTGPRSYTNEFGVLAERQVGVSFECFAAAVLVKTSAVRS